MPSLDLLPADRKNNPILGPAAFPSTRMRRLRHHSKVRDLVRETELQVTDLAAVLFVKPGKGIKTAVSSMPGVFQMSPDIAVEEAKEIAHLGIPAVILFGIPAAKDATGSGSYNHNGIVQTTIRAIKAAVPELLVISDICLCEYTDHGHCGIVNHKTGRADVDNDATLELLQQQAVSHAEAGADVLAPSGNIDGMVAAIRYALDCSGFQHLPILSYAVKFASGMYGPFREAADGAPKFGNRSSYQMDPANGEEALREVALDIQEGADIVMVKPAMTYLDVISRVTRAHPEVPCAAYHVSGEYALIKAAAEKGWIDEERVALEVLTGIKRAGARFIFTYYAKEAAIWLSDRASR